MSKSRPHELKIQAYLKPREHRMVSGYAKLNETSQSKVIVEAIRKLFSEMPQDILYRILNDEAKIKHPH